MLLFIIIVHMLDEIEIYCSGTGNGTIVLYWCLGTSFNPFSSLHDLEPKNEH